MLTTYVSSPKNCGTMGLWSVCFIQIHVGVVLSDVLMVYERVIFLFG